MNEYYCAVNICWAGNNFEAKNKEEYIQKVKDSFKEEFGITIVDDEIKDITKEKEDE